MDEIRTNRLNHLSSLDNFTENSIIYTKTTEKYRIFEFLLDGSVFFLKVYDCGIVPVFTFIFQLFDPALSGQIHH
jgi:hypothetical protein